MWFQRRALRKKKIVQCKQGEREMVENVYRKHAHQSLRSDHKMNMILPNWVCRLPEWNKNTANHFLTKLPEKNSNVIWLTRRKLTDTRPEILDEILDLSLLCVILQDLSMTHTFYYLYIYISCSFHFDHAFPKPPWAPPELSQPTVSMASLDALLKIKDWLIRAQCCLKLGISRKYFLFVWV